MTFSAPIITVFGGSGFVGRAIVAALARHLTQDGIGNVAIEPVIRVATRNPAKAEPLRQLGKVGQITPVFCDPSDATQVAAAVRGSSAVVNCIGILAEPAFGKRGFDHVHAEIPGIIARAVADAGVSGLGGAPLVHISALGADANSPSRYARSKAAGEGVVRAILPMGAILRPSIVFGPEDAFFNRFAKMALLSPALPLIGGGQTKFQPVYMGDVANAVLSALMSPSARGQTFALGGPQIYTFKQLLQLMLQAIGRQRLLVTLPFGFAKFQGMILQNLPGQLLTVDQVKLLMQDNVADRILPGLVQLGVAPTAVEAILPTYMDRFRPRGRFAR